MKKCILLIVICLAISSNLLAQTLLSSETRHQLESISMAVKGITPDHDWIAQNLGNKPVYFINGEFCLSMVARVDQEYSERDLRGIGYPGSQVGTVATIKIPLKKLYAELQIPHVQYLEIATSIQPHLNKLTNDVRADSVWAGIDLPHGFTGKGVLIGISDWGFDYGHPMFMDTTLSTSRIRAAWDQFKLSGTPPAGMSYGAEYSTPQMLSGALCDTAGIYYDYATHGSHVAGIAGGSGAGTKYRGVAFESQYLFASQLLDAGSAIDAFKWMMSVADADGKRLVVNMSWGLYYMGTMDGTSLLSQAIDQLSKQGVVFVTSAGNNGDVNFHIKKDFNNDSIRTRISFYGYSQHPAMWGQCITMWGEPSKPFGAQLEIYDAANILLNSSAVFNTSLNAGYIDTMMVIGTDTILYNFNIDDAHPLNLRPHIQLRVQSKNALYRVVLSSFAPAGTVHYWNVVELSNGVGNWGLPLYAFGNNGVAGDSRYSLGEPACTGSVITVAAHSSEYVMGTGTVVPGNRATFSSIGPTYDERMKPDLSAPGVNVISSINSYTTAQYTSSAQIQYNGRTYHFAAFSGTSMSSPAVTGAAAIVLEANPDLTASQVKEILKNTARQDTKTGVINWPGSTSWGMGKVTLTDAVPLALNTVRVIDPGTSDEVMVYPNPATDQIRVVLSDGKMDFCPFQLLNWQGQIVSGGWVNSGSVIPLSHLPDGMYLLRVEVPGKEFLVAKVMKL
jgi:minor extracellular serine protease Vpr